MTAVFTAAPEFTVLTGATEIGRIDPSLLTEKVTGDRAAPARRPQLAGHLRRLATATLLRRAADGGGRARWMTAAWPARLRADPGDARGAARRGPAR